MCVGARSPHFSLEGHEKGVNCIDYYPGGDKVGATGLGLRLQGGR